MFFVDICIFLSYFIYLFGIYAFKELFIFYSLSIDRLVGLGSACLTTDYEVAGSIPGTSTILNVY